jgi:hypothetical protein
VVDNTQHDGQERNAEDVVAVGEETCTSDQNCADMIPAERRLVDFSERKTAALVGVLDMRKVLDSQYTDESLLCCKAHVVEVVEAESAISTSLTQVAPWEHLRIVASGGLVSSGSHDEALPRRKPDSQEFTRRLDCRERMVAGHQDQGTLW